MNAARKPPSKIPAKAQLKKPYVVRLTPDTVDRIQALALAKGIGHTTLARDALLHGLKYLEMEEVMKTHTRITA